MIVVDKPGVTDLYIPKNDSCGCGLKKGVFGRKDIETILAGYVTKEEFAAEIARLEQMIEELK
jgi:hypothetical protein